MRLRLAGAILLVVGVGTATVSGRTINMTGSPILGSLTRDVINGCPAIAGPSELDSIAFIETGSGTAEADMAANPPTQTEAPMARFLQAGPIGNAAAAKACDTDSGTGIRAEGIVVALDSTGLVANTTNSNDCGGVSTNRSFTVTDEDGNGVVDCLGTSCPDGTYSPSSTVVTPGATKMESWGDFIRLAFFGIEHSSTVTGGVRNCGGDARRSLLKKYNQIFQTDCAGGSCSTSGVHHLWRLNDVSPVPDSFASLLGTSYTLLCNAGNVIPGTVAQGFSDFLDRDPIRVPCLGNGGNNGDQVCGSARVSDSYDSTKNTLSPDGNPIGANVGTLGMVQVVSVPEPRDVPVNEWYATTACGTESVLLEAATTTYTGVCPSGGPSFNGQCFTSVIRTAPAGHPVEEGFNANCFQRFTTTACPFLTPAGVDCRGANLWPRHANGKIFTDTTLSLTGRKVLGAAYRIHQTKGLAGTVFCQKPTANEQIACLVGDADTCSLGFAGRSAFDPVSTATGLSINGRDPSADNVRNLITDPANGYPLARRLYLASINGFGNVSTPELAMARCYVDDALMGTATVPGLVFNNGLITLPDRAGKPRQICQDFHEENATTTLQPDTGCGVGTGVNACADNGPLGLPVD